MENNVFRFEWNHNFSFSWKVNSRKKIKGRMVSLLIAVLTQLYHYYKK